MPTGRAGARPVFLWFLLTALLASCVGAEGLMQAPRAAVQYRNLQAQIDALLDSGYIYSAPVTGDHRQAVLTADLTGGGREDAVVFLRGETENLLAVFLQGDGEFTPLPPVSENAESVHSVVFADLDGDGGQEIVVGWQAGPLSFVSVYALDESGLIEIFSRRFSGYTVYDIEDTGVPALLLIQADPAEQVVEMVSFRDGELVITDQAYLSRGAETVLRIRTGPLLDGRPGLFVASRFPFEEQTWGEVTDVLTFRDGGLVNISANMETGISDALVRQVSHPALAAADIDNDGVLDLPRMVELERHPEDESGSDPFYEIRWTAYESGGLFTETARTYQSFIHNWYILLPEQWPEKYTVRREILSAAQSVTIFSNISEGPEPIDFLKIYYLTQSASARPPVRNRTVLVEQDNLLVTAEIIPMRDDLEHYNISEQELKTLFNMVPADWRMS
jgi:hypothetical protein